MYIVLPSKIFPAGRQDGINEIYLEESAVIYDNESTAVSDARVSAEAHAGLKYLVFKAVAVVGREEAPIKVTRFE